MEIWDTLIEYLGKYGTVGRYEPSFRHFLKNVPHVARAQIMCRGDTQSIGTRATGVSINAKNVSLEEQSTRMYGASRKAKN